MRLMKIHLIVLAILLIGGMANAARFEFTTTDNYNGTDTLGFSDTITVDVFINTGTGRDGTGINFFSIGLLFDDQELDYVPIPNCSPPCDGTPTYILYSPAAGMTPLTILYPQQDPWAFWPAPPTGSNDPGNTLISQLNINWVQSDVLTPATLEPPETPLQIAKFIFHVGSGGDGTADITVSKTSGGNSFRQNDQQIDLSDDDLVSIPASPITVTVPEPAIVGLSIAALATMLAVRARRRSV